MCARRKSETLQIIRARKPNFVQRFSRDEEAASLLYTCRCIDVTTKRLTLHLYGFNKSPTRRIQFLFQLWNNLPLKQFFLLTLSYSVSCSKQSLAYSSYIFAYLSTFAGSTVCEHHHFFGSGFPFHLAPHTSTIYHFHVHYCVTAKQLTLNNMQRNILTRKVLYMWNKMPFGTKAQIVLHFRARKFPTSLLA